MLVGQRKRNSLSAKVGRVFPGRARLEVLGNSGCQIGSLVCPGVGTQPFASIIALKFLGGRCTEPKTGCPIVIESPDYGSLVQAFEGTKSEGALETLSIVKSSRQVWPIETPPLA